MSLRREWSMVKKTVLAMQNPRDSMLSLWQLLVQHDKDEFLNLLKLAYIAVTVPLLVHTSTADRERAFSLQNHIVTKLRNRLTVITGSASTAHAN